MAKGKAKEELPASRLAPICPGNAEVEQSLIGAALINNEAIRMVEGIITHEDFMEPINGHLWKVMLDAERAGKKIDVKLLVAALGNDAKVKLLGDFTVGQYIARLASEAVTVINAPDYANVIRNIADQNRMAEMGAMLRQELPVDVDDLGAAVIDRLDGLLTKRTRSNTPAVMLSEAMANAIDATAKAYAADGKPTGIPTGLVDLDHQTLGLHRGELTILAGRPGMGKTALGLAITYNVAQQNEPTLFFSLEMGDASLGQRILSDALYSAGKNIPYFNLRAGRVTEKEFEAVADMAKVIGQYPMKIEQQPGMTVAQIGARARQFVRRHGKLSLLVVDHLHLVRPSDRYAGKRVEEIGETTSGLKALAKELNVPVLALCQLSRGVEAREDKRPGMQDLRGSGDIEQDADTILMLFRAAYYHERSRPNEINRDEFAGWLAEGERLINQLEVIIEKQRNGPIGTVELFCSIQHNAVRNLTRTDHLPVRDDFPEDPPAPKPTQGRMI